MQASPGAPGRAARRHLERRAKRLNEEITRYPTPIARCDQHLAALLEQRAAIYGRLQLAGDASGGMFRGLEAFLASPADGADETEEALRARLRGELAKHRS